MKKGAPSLSGNALCTLSCQMPQGMYKGEGNTGITNFTNFNHINFIFTMNNVSLPHRLLMPSAL